MSCAVHGFLLIGWDAVAVHQVIQKDLAGAATNGGGRVDPRARVLFDRLTAYLAESCAAQPAQPSTESDEQWWPDNDLISVQEAAKIMDCSESNVRARAGRGSLAGINPGDRWFLSRTDVLSAARKRAGR